jgi:ribonucleoside-diphosphate reductase alpha chain
MFAENILARATSDTLTRFMQEMKFIPGGRYLYYAGRTAKFFNNCYLLKAEEDTREDWANLSWKAESCLMTGGGIGVDYSYIVPLELLLDELEAQLVRTYP